MSRVPYAIVVDSLMYTMVCTRPNLSLHMQSVLLVGSWEILVRSIDRQLRGFFSV